MKEGGYYPPSFAFQERNGKAFQSEVYRVYRLVAGVADEFFPAQRKPACYPVCKNIIDIYKKLLHDYIFKKHTHEVSRRRDRVAFVRKSFHCRL
jgi:hypothetical protein